MNRAPLGPARRPVTHRAVFTALALALAWITAVASPAGAAETSPATAWTATEARPPGADQGLLEAAGWACVQALDLPAGSDRLLVLCRRAAAEHELRLLVLSRGDGAQPRVLTRLADAAKATLRAFTPASACAPGAGADCLAAVILVDQRDEGLCYGTQVIAVPADKPVRSLGFIDEWRPAGDESVCIGGFARVTGSGAAVRIDLPGPLARTRRDGKVQPLAARTIGYRIVAGKPALQRLPAGR